MNIIKRLYSSASQFKKVDYDTVNFHRRISPNKTYHPSELNERLQKTKAKAPKKDLLKLLSIDIKKEYKNTKLLANFLTTMGYIKSKEENGLSLKNQKRTAKAIKRARHFGLLPFSYKPF
jgi:ribosomal protein S18